MGGLFYNICHYNIARYWPLVELWWKSSPTDALEQGDMTHARSEGWLRQPSPLRGLGWAHSQTSVADSSTNPLRPAWACGWLVCNLGLGQISLHLVALLLNQLKADRPPPRNYPHTLTDNRHTDEHPRLVMTLLCWSETQTHGWTDGRTDGRYQVHYLPRFAVDKKGAYPAERTHVFIGSVVGGRRECSVRSNSVPWEGGEAESYRKNREFSANFQCFATYLKWYIWWYKGVDPGAAKEVVVETSSIWADNKLSSVSGNSITMSLIEAHTLPDTVTLPCLLVWRWTIIRAICAYTVGFKKLPYRADIVAGDGQGNSAPNHYTINELHCTMVVTIVQSKSRQDLSW